MTQFFFPERFLLNQLAEELADNKTNTVTVLTGQPNYPDGKVFNGYSNCTNWTEQLNNITIIRVPVFARREGKAWQLVLNYTSFIMSCILFGVPRILFKKIDIVFAWGTSPILQAIPAIIIKLIKRKKLILWLQDLWPETLTAVGMIKSQHLISCVGMVVKIIYKLTDKILIQSPSFKDSVLKYGGSEDKIEWVPNWSMASTETSAPVPSPPIFQKEKFNILFAGNLGKAQNLEVILKCAKNLINDLHIHFVILGEGSEKENMQKNASKDSLTNITFLPGRPVNEMPYYFSSASALLVTLIEDPTIERVIPSKVQSYMSSGKPILASVNGQARDTLKEANCALVSPANDDKQLSENIKKMAYLSDKDLMNLGNNGKSYYHNFFDKNKVINRINSILEKGVL